MLGFLVSTRATLVHQFHGSTKVRRFSGDLYDPGNERATVLGVTATNGNK